MTGWSYWFMWVVTAMAELTAIGIYVHFWLPDVPRWVPGLCALAILYATNSLAVRVYGELEFWFALLKIISIVALIISGLAVIVFKLGTLGPTASFSNLWTRHGFMPFGLFGVLLTLQIVMFAHSGVELIGVTAGEAENPEIVLPRATNSIIFRILLFYIGALVVIMALVPWDELNPDMSPFVTMFEKMGITVLNYEVPKQAFAFVTSIALIGTLWTWIIVMYSHAKCRRTVEEGRARAVSYQMPGWPYANLIVIAFLLVVATLLWLDSNTRVALSCDAA